MVSNKHDFTDSEPEIEGDGESIIEAGPSDPRKRQLSEGPAESSNAGGYSRGGSEDFDQLLGDDDEEGQVDAKPVPPPKKAKKAGKEGNPLKITLRPGINNLINSSSDSKPPSKPKATRHSDRSSLSPPPPITLKFGLKSAMAEKASYSSSEDDDPLPIPPPNPPSKKKKSSTPSSTSKSSAKNKASSVTAAGGTPTGPSAHKKSYDWLAPSVAGASHRGPPEREKEKERERQGSNGKITGWSPADEAIGGLLDDSPDTAAEKKLKKSHKKRSADAPPGPGKAWRKGVKKSMANSVKAEDGLSTPGGSPLVHAATPISREVSPEPIELPPRMTVERPMVPPIAPTPRAPSPPFVLADAKELGFPVFPNPIHAPKIPLGAFPKVTQYFAPLNGGDVGPFPRKEPVRSWTQGEKVIVGIGGGQLKIKSWAMGPPSELSRLVQADKEAKELARLAKIKSNNTTANTPTPNQGATTPTVEERPGLNTVNSFDASTSINVTPVLAPTDPAKEGEKEKGEKEETMSEIADLDELQLQSGQNTPPIPVPVPVTQTTPTPKTKVKNPGGGGGTKSKKGAAPRKSNLRQEILPLSGEGEAEGNDELAITAGENEN
ncbi:hypothetical protein I302_101932 [Kwoniella bestiolae CBS 10118]|uniref:Uncharacterized protein n=1 Tax=Kwoniella bestiolae CBS 10118 TaxID=1296100 RepID=A0A1B9GDM8_9TREE|nr:hypothetical protein I302_00615 [Kwoniella bestiolae CBS 10118]OCF29120.1 hypothetical protein I302_00615 [Kwoniella bestiolae CBS 10118]